MWVEGQVEFNCWVSCSFKTVKYYKNEYKTGYPDECFPHISPHIQCLTITSCLTEGPIQPEMMQIYFDCHTSYDCLSNVYQNVMDSAVTQDFIQSSHSPVDKVHYTAQQETPGGSNE